MIGRGAHNIIITRLSEEKEALLQGKFLYRYAAAAHLAVANPAERPLTGDIAVVSAGTSDLAACEEAALTAEALGSRVHRVYDAGVAGLHRLLGSLETLEKARCIVAVAGVGVLLAMLVCTVLGMVIERLAYKPLRQATSLAVLITAIGVSYFLQNGAQLLWTSNIKMFPSFFSASPIEFFGGELKITIAAIVTVAACVVIMLGLTWFTGRTRMGKAMRACSEDKAAAQLMGINVNATISMTFAIGSALAAVAGVLYMSSYPILVPTTGSMPGIKAFTAAVFGGIGSIPGALLGGLLLGIIEIFAGGYISTQLQNAIVFAVLIVVLLVKPTGLLGKQIREKV